MVAKSYQDFPQVCEPYKIGVKQYVKVRKPNGDIVQVRFYTEAEYEKYYGKAGLETAKQSQKDAFGFTDGYITIIKGDSYPYKDYLKQEGAKYSQLWGWYFASGMSIPELADGLSAVRVDWDLVGQENGLLKSESVVKAEIAKLTYEPSSSKFVGEIGERLEVNVVVKRIVPLENYYGTTIYTFEDEDKNVFVWKTTPRPFEVGEHYTLRGTVKQHNIFREVEQTILTRCKVMEE